MSIKKYIANKDTTITNAFKEDSYSRATIANMGASDSLEVFSIYGQTFTSSLEKSRILVEFPINDILNDRSSSVLPNSGSVEFYLRMFNVAHPFSVPRDFTLNIYPLSSSWDEGYGLDMEGYTDNGFSDTLRGYGTNWLFRQSGSYWLSQGGDYLTSSQYAYTASFTSGLENITVNVTNIVEKWINGDIQNNGFIVFLSGVYEDGTTNQSFYTKKFSARGSEYYFNRPCIEARWNPVTTDDRINFYASSSMLSAEDNKMNLYFYNKVNGKLKNIVGNPIPNIKFYSNADLTSEVTSSNTSVTNPSVGIYKAIVSINTTASVLYDKWFNSSSLDKYYSGSFDVYNRINSDSDTESEYIINITNLKSRYSQEEQARFNIFVRESDWQPTIYTVAYNNIENTSIPNLYYKIFRFNDNYTIVDYSTGSLAYTKTSYDSSGNYFNFDMKILEKDYGYGIKLAMWDGTQLKEFKNIFKFRVE